VCTAIKWTTFVYFIECLKSSWEVRVKFFRNLSMALPIGSDNSDLSLKHTQMGNYRNFHNMLCKKSQQCFLLVVDNMVSPHYVSLHRQAVRFGLTTEKRTITNALQERIFSVQWLSGAYTGGKGKGKGHPRTGHEGPKRSRGIALLFL